MTGNLRRVGLTGGIGSGKSTAAAILVDCGAALVDTDALSRGLTAPGGAAVASIAAAFGEAFVAADGALDRTRMRELVFRDPAAKSRLEALLHPLIGAQADAAARSAAARVVVFDVPLLAESATWRSRVDRVLVIDCRQSTQIERVAARPGWTTDTAARVVAQQATRELRRSIADAVIFNDGIDRDTLRAHVLDLWQRWAG